MEAVSQELYEQVRAQVLADLKTERREQSQENIRTNKAARAMFDELKAKYMPKLIANTMKMFPHRTDHYWISQDKFEHVTQMALSVVGERNTKTAYRNGKAEEAVKAAEEIFADMFREEKET